MSQAIDLCEGDSDDNGEWSNTASVHSLPLSRKRPSANKESCNGDHPRNKNGPGNKTATGSVKFVVDMELADEVEVSPHKKRRGVTKSVQNDAAGNSAQMLKEFEAEEKDVDSEDAQVADHRESHEGIAALIAAASSHPMNSDSKQTSQDDRSANKHSQKVSTSKPPANASGRQGRDSAWENRFSEIADYRKIHGHCNVPRSDGEKSKLANWVVTQRSNYRLHAEGKTSPMTSFRINCLESLGFEWRIRLTAWEDRLSELADYRKIHGHCNVPDNYIENTKLGSWVGIQRRNYRLHLEGKKTFITLSRIQELESLGFEWNSYGATWKDRLSELAAYRQIQGHCNVPKGYSKSTKLAHWVATQRTNYWLHREGKTSPMTSERVKALEGIGFVWNPPSSSWENRLSELADHRKIHGHCNVPRSYGEKSKLAIWVNTQRSNYWLHLEGKTSPMTLSQIRELENLGFEWEWDSRAAAWEDRLSELADYRKIHGHCNIPKIYSENFKLGEWVATQRYQYRLHEEGKRSPMTPFRIQELESLGIEWRARVTAWEDRLSELADYRKIHGHCNVPRIRSYSENTKVANWVKKQRTNYRLHLAGKPSQMTLPRIQELESLGFEWEWDSRGAAWENRLSELADYKKIHGHCNVPDIYSENIKLGKWVATQRNKYRLHREGKISQMTPFRIQELENLGFEWRVCVDAWEDRLSELADYRKNHGHCNVPKGCSESTKLAHWVATQRNNYWLHQEGKTSPMTTFRIEELESLGFEWKPSVCRRKGTPKKPSLDEDATRVDKRAVVVPEHMQ
jgi:hypothetical protein